MERYTKFLLFNGYDVPDRIRELLELCGEDNRTGEIIACLEKEGLHDFAVTDGVSVGAYSYLKKHHKAILASKESVYQYRAKAPHQLQTEYYGWNERTKRVCSVRVVEIPREGKKRLTSTRGVEGLMELKQPMTKEAKDKKEFVEELGKLLANFNESHGTNYFSGIKRMDYVEEDGEEFVYITYEKYTQKRICVTCDSVEAIMLDFVNHVDSAAWLLSSDSKYRSEFTV